MGLVSGDVSKRQVTYSFTDEEKARWQQFYDKNNITQVGDIIAYYEAKGVEIDGGCPNCWPVGGPKALQNEYFECKTCFMEINGLIPHGTGTCAPAPASDNDSSGNTNTDSSNQAQNAVDALAEGAANTAESVQSTIDNVADAARNATEAAVEKAFNIANDAKDAALDFANGLQNEATQKLASLKAQAESFLGSSLAKVSKIAAFSLPEIKIPSLKLIDPNKYISKLIDTFDPSGYLGKQVKNLKDQLGKIEEIREALEGDRLTAELKELAENLGCQEKYLDALSKLSEGAVEAIGEMAGEAMDNIANTINSAIDAAADGMAEALGAAAEAVANGEQMAADTLANLVDGLTEAGADVDSAMKAVFGDESGKAAEAVAEADTEAGIPMRGNGPCGGGTKDVGGVNHNEPDEEKEEENANEKAYYLDLFKKACEKGDMNNVEKYYDILVNKFNESPSLLKNLLAELMKTAPQTKAGIARVNAILNKAEETIASYGEGISNTVRGVVEDVITTKNALADDITSLKNGATSILDNSRNMNTALLESKDVANMMNAAKQFTRDIANNAVIARLQAVGY